MTAKIKDRADKDILRKEFQTELNWYQPDMVLSKHI